MSRFIESTPCKEQARIMRKLGFRVMDTDDGMTAVWQQGLCVMHLPASWNPHEADVVQRLISQCHSDGMAAARAQMRQALGMSGG